MVVEISDTTFVAVLVYPSVVDPNVEVAIEVYSLVECSEVNSPVVNTCVVDLNVVASSVVEDSKVKSVVVYAFVVDPIVEV